MSPYSRNELIAYLEEGGETEFLAFYGHTPAAPGVVGKSCFSQWYPARFEIDGMSYATAEHYMMAEKARLFGDSLHEQEILSSNDPGKAKAMGRKVEPFDPDIWNAACFDIVVRGNLAKFSQNEELKDFLLATKGKVLVEAAPRDPVWGIGLGIDNPAVSQPAQWRGQNLLGFALMKARDVILKKGSIE